MPGVAAPVAGVQRNVGVELGEAVGLGMAVTVQVAVGVGEALEGTGLKVGVGVGDEPDPAGAGFKGGKENFFWQAPAIKTKAKIKRINNFFIQTASRYANQICHF